MNQFPELSINDSVSEESLFRVGLKAKELL